MPNPIQNRYPGIPDPRPDIQGLLVTVQALKEAVETLTNQRRAQPPVTWTDLVRLNLVSDQDVPR